MMHLPLDTKNYAGVLMQAYWRRVDKTYSEAGKKPPPHNADSPPLIPFEQTYGHGRGRGFAGGASGAVKKQKRAALRDTQNERRLKQLLASAPAWLKAGVDAGRQDRHVAYATPDARHAAAERVVGKKRKRDS